MKLSGTMWETSAWTVGRCENWANKYYLPNNVMLLILIKRKIFVYVCVLFKKQKSGMKSSRAE